jgi:hypothetical protein
MKANELRIGNFVSIDGVLKPIKVFIIDTTETSVNTKYKPIPLTEEWLLKFGFVYNIDSYYKRHTESETNFDWDIETGLYIIDDNGLVLKDISHIEYVHQLQNLYFALTGEELEVKS